MMGRPVKSEIRERIIDILYVIKEAYGYEIYQYYKNLFPKITMRSIYYNLEKGVALDEIEISRTEKTEGKYSWGNVSERNYYRLGKNAMANPDGELIRKISRLKTELKKN
ncbi:MAG: hypothetical protein NTV63_02580 [Candidatus Woesearchaeota archaeon]|nr:hypothetical protein [Candidatus Woesearchaeota archaeon]